MVSTRRLATPISDVIYIESLKAYLLLKLGCCCRL